MAKFRQLVDSGKITTTEAEAMLSGSLTPPRMKSWPTPNHRDYKGVPGRVWSGQSSLPRAVKYPTPATRDYKGARSPEALDESGRNPNTNSLGDAIGEGAVKGQLNPDWVEWLMGWPIGWSKLEPIQMRWLTWEIDPADSNSIPRIGRNIKDRAKRLKAIGNGQVPQCMAEAWRLLT